MTQESKIITQKDVATLAGVSRSVVSYVLNDGPRKVAPETRRRVLEAIEQLGYHPNKYAQRLKLGSCSAKRCMGIIVSGRTFGFLEHASYNSILTGMFEEAHKVQQEIRLFSCFEALTDPVFFNKNIHPEEISSLVLVLPQTITSVPDHQKLLDQIARRIKNVVCLGEPIKGWPTVSFDHALAAQQAVEHLIQLGHQRIAYLGVSDGRLTGYQQTLELHGLAYEGGLVEVTTLTNIATTAYQLTEKLLRATPRPTALFTACDEIAVNAMAAIHDHGLSIPRDIAIASIDNTKLADIIRPSLTSVNVPHREMASQAIQLLMALQEGRQVKTKSILVPTELVIRESSGA
ncbi:MAG: LacI family DNA-binding transcriptional regulator [Anaerolineaceae bacterium]|nr:LacI family DNA-binding transcriptional regulator [Anaerolineaceae bacterium]